MGHAAERNIIILLYQSVKGVIIALEDDLRIRRALQVANNIDFYRYEVSFKLNKEQV